MSKDETEEKGKVVSEQESKSEAQASIKEETREEEEVTTSAKEKRDIVEERVYTVPLRRAWLAPRNVRSEKATRTLREFIMKHMKTGINSIKITNEVNEKIWSRGIQKPPRKIRVRVEKDSEGVVTVYLAERS
ncbi:MAG: 50S ribosomal protein L31e [Nitrososphaerota archaeon]|nr:50S ribosomal protein L31e [Nitrososphaerota archaeon]